MQSQHNKLSFAATARKIYHSEGIKGFYAGLIPNFARVVLKTLYRIPMMLELPHSIAKVSALLLNHQMSAVTCKSIAGVMIAGF